jgi:UDP-N-acetylglucosamine 2-epimerase (non-hydrolysing)
MKILFFIGTRPEAIKMICPILELKKNKFDVKVCSTGQHSELLEDVFDVFNFKPNYKYKIFDRNNNINTTFSKIVDVASKTIIKNKPKIVFVHGDTLNTFACATAAFNLNIRVAHVEAGLRSYNRYFPWPEEVYRRVVTSLTDYHFAPTHTSRQNLLNENIDKNNIFVTGNTVIDALKYILALSKKSSVFKNSFNIFLKKINFKKSEFNILVTSHRREQIGKNIILLCKEINKIASTKNVKIYFVLHHNTLIIKPVKKYLKNNKNIILLQPQKYDFFLNLLKLSDLIITDSGGIQEEITALNKICLINRDVTERVEVMKSENAFLVGSNSKNLYINFKKIFKMYNQKKIIKPIKKIYGNGNSSKKIVNIMKTILTKINH